MHATSKTLEIIPRRLYWLSSKSPPTSSKIHILNTDDTLTYIPFNTDFGPLDLSQIVQYCKTLTSLLAQHTKTPICHHTSIVPAKRANSALLICAYQVLVLKKHPEDAWEPFVSTFRFLPYRDASAEPNKFELKIFDCLCALFKAQSLNWLDVNTFDVDEYQKCSLAKNGAFNWIVPEKLIAFPCPSGRSGLAVEEYSRLFTCCGVTAIIRIHQPTYDGIRFKKQGIRHFDIEETTDKLPDDATVSQFIEICRREHIIAVHCQDGLGKSMTLIGCYVIKHFSLTGREFIAWARMCRPGSVLDQQQLFLCSFYDNLCAISRRSRQSSLVKLEIETIISPLVKKKCISVNGYSGTTKVMRDAVRSEANYKTKFNQLVKIDPEMMKLYGKKWRGTSVDKV